MTVKAFQTEVHGSTGLSVTPALENSNILLYSLLALSMLLVVSSLSLALAVFPRKSRASPSNSGAKKASNKQECVVETGPLCGQQTAKGPGEVKASF